MSTIDHLLATVERQQSMIADLCERVSALESRGRIVATNPSLSADDESPADDVNFDRAVELASCIWPTRNGEALYVTREWELDGRARFFVEATYFDLDGDPYRAHVGHLLMEPKPFTPGGQVWSQKTPVAGGRSSFQPIAEIGVGG